jgi:signal transduction histidine kinase
MAPSRITSPLLWLLGLMFLLIPALAWLQWRWIGEISDRESERLRLNVRTSATYTSWNFNQRFMALQQAFAISASDQDSAIVEELSEAWNLWKQHSDSSLVESVYFLRGTDKKLYRFDLSSKQLLPVSDTILTALHLDFAGAPPINRLAKGLRALVLSMYPKNAHDSGFPRTNGTAVAAGKESASKKSAPLDAPQEMSQKSYSSHHAPPKESSQGGRYIPNMTGGFTMSYVIVVPDSIYLRQRFIPALVRTYFQAHDYRWAVVQNDDSTLLSVSEPSLSLRDVAKPDVATPIGFIPPRPQGRMGRAMAAMAARMPLVMATENDSLLNIEKSAFPAPQEGERSIGERSIRGIDSSMMREFLGTTEFRVVAARGSLEREVAALRWRNLAVSFGALLVLAGGLVVVFAAVARSERLARQQMQFVAGVSHELRTPLAVLHSASENLSDGIVKTPEQARRYGQVMKREITRLVEMVEQTLTFAGIQSGKRTFEFQPTDVQTLIEDCLERNATFLQGENCTPEIHVQSGLPPIHADSRALGSVLDNLLANAVKYSVGGCRVRITSSIVGKELVIAVQDSGRGIAAKEQKRIFEPFYRTRETIDAQIHGNGLGLSIVQHIVKQHGGYVQVVSELGKGSTFSVHFPLAKQFTATETIVKQTAIQQPV